MLKLIILGSASAVPDKDHENTHFVIISNTRKVLVDCVGNPLLRMEKAGISLDGLDDVILTHCHPDHISGVPSMLMNLWLMGRRKPLDIYGLHHTLDCVEKMMALYEWEDWPNFFPIVFHRLPAQEMEMVLEDDLFRIFASPVKHLLPTIGLRIESLQNNKTLAYSCDTEPCPEVIRLGVGVEILIHEAAGQSLGHSSAAQAGEVATLAGAKSLYLIHYPPQVHGSQELLDEARNNFNGEVSFAEDFMEMEL